MRRVYLPEGIAPIANVNWRFQWLWLYAFVHPKTGETKVWILPYVNTELFNRVLADFAHQFNLGANKGGLRLELNYKLSNGLNITQGQGYSTIAWIPETQASWALPLRHELLTSWESPIDKAVWQLSQVCQHLPQRPISLWDNQYGCAPFVLKTAQIAADTFVAPALKFKFAWRTPALLWQRQTSHSW